MNVLKKDILAKAGARSTSNRNSFANLTTFNTARFVQNALPFLPNPSSAQKGNSSSFPTGSSSLTRESIFDVPSKNPAGKNEFHSYIQPFVAEIGRPSGYSDSNGLAAAETNLFKKPIHTPSSARQPSTRGSSSGNFASSGRAEESGTTADVLKVLSENSFERSSHVTSSAPTTNESASTSHRDVQDGDGDISLLQLDLNYRAPRNQDDEFHEDVADRGMDHAYSKDSTISSIRAKNSDKITPRLDTRKSPKTPKNTSSTAGGPSDSDVSCCIIAVTEGRGQASGEVGIAAMDPRRPHLVICQISDSQRYARTLAKMNIFNFIEVIVPNTFVDGPAPRKLYIELLERFPAVTVNHVQRRHFSEAAGLQMIQQYCSRESESIMVVLKDKFYGLAAAAALLKYIEFTQSVLFAPYSLKVEYQGTEGTTIIDLDTANRLELVMGMVSRDEQQSLLGVLKHCRTKGGMRLLRASLLQPPSDTARINSRLDCVTELIENPILFNSLEVVISQMKNAESLLGLCMHPPQQTGLKAAQYQLKYALLLKTTLELVPALTTALADANSDYFRAVHENLGDTRLKSVLSKVHKIVLEGSPGSRPGAFNQLHACFMICAGINGLLDIAKKTYCELAQEIADLVDGLKERLGLPIRLGFSQGRGYHIVISPLDQVPVDNLPPELILSNKTRNSITCYTTELVALDQRCQQALHEIELMTNVLLFELLNDVREEIACLYPLCESLAELDVCIAFAHVGAVEGYVRPSFADELHLVKARHPILDVTAKERVVANDVFADEDNNFMILTGPNQSGKSIYIRQIALLQVMAQVGCYVPAVSATFRVADRIFSRIGFDDSIEGNASTLMVELQDMEFIHSNLTKNSLVIVDELCRGTSVDEGTVLAMVLCEQLIDTSAFVFFTTHFLFLTKLRDMYYNVRNYHFETALSNEARPSLRYTYKMVEGVTRAEQYGIQLAEQMGYIPSILEAAKQTASLLLADRKPQPEVCQITDRYMLSQKMRMNLPQRDDATWEQVLPVIRQYKQLYELLPPEGQFLQEYLSEDTDGADLLQGSQQGGVECTRSLDELQSQSPPVDTVRCPRQADRIHSVQRHSSQIEVLAIDAESYRLQSENQPSPRTERTLSQKSDAEEGHQSERNTNSLPSSQSSKQGTVIPDAPPPESPINRQNLQRTVLKPSCLAATVSKIPSETRSTMRVSDSEEQNQELVEFRVSGSSVVVEQFQNTGVNPNFNETNGSQIEGSSVPSSLPLSESANYSSQSETTTEAALLLLSLGGNQPSTSRALKKRKPHPAIPKKEKKPRKRTIGKTLVGDFLRGLGSDLPPVSDKAQYYQWKYANDQKAVQTIATCSRMSSASSNIITSPAISLPQSRSNTKTSSQQVDPSTNNVAVSTIRDVAAGDVHSPESPAHKYCEPEEIQARRTQLEVRGQPNPNEGLIQQSSSLSQSQALSPTRPQSPVQLQPYSDKYDENPLNFTIEIDDE